ncbi:MAG: tRNA(His) guanylyltransferase Thg1 family protein, partial [Candidatus Thorarchaeota archaeon]
MSKRDDFGDRIKGYEAQHTSQKLIPQLPVIARLDGRSFSKYTIGFNRPYDERMSQSMIETAKHLVDKFDANVGYVQSDEITLGWYNNEPKAQSIFNGKVFKLLSLLAAEASVKFNDEIRGYMGGKTVDKIATFDCRVFNTPTLSEGTNAFVWREI